jgi:regulator of cell morphogenesis and NO signaling
MSVFTAEMRLSSVIHQNYLLLPVINRFGIRLGFRDQTIEQVCAQYNINTALFLALLNTFNNEEYFPEKELKTFSPSLLVDYLQKTHTYYLSYLVPNIEKLLDKMLGTDTRDTKLKIIRSFYSEYNDELLAHITREDEKVFPYIRALQSAVKELQPLPVSFAGYSILRFEKEHNDIDEKLLDLKNIVIKYLEPAYDDNDCNAFLFALFQFERDLQDHTRIENKILIPTVLELEKAIKNG